MSTATPGRPAIGPKVPINFPAGLLQAIDEAADLARTSRAAWIRNATARALPETFEGPITADQLGQYLRGSSLGEDLNDPDRDVHVDGDTAMRLLRAADDGTLSFGLFTTESMSVETANSRQRLAFITRSLSTGQEAVTIYQVSYSTVSAPQVGESVVHRQRTLFLDEGAARLYYEDMRDHTLKSQQD